jgi:uncharacterized protein (DUF305 family)
MELRRPAARVAAIVLAVVLAGCGGNSAAPEGTPGGAAGSNRSPDGRVAADVEFAKQMIPHHAQALVLVDVSAERSKNPAIQQLGESIRAAQVPEIESLASMLERWGEEVPSTSRDHASAHGHGAADHGISSAAEVDRLRKARGTESDRMFLELMIRHHEGAVAMARTELAEGRDPAARELAERIVADQQREIEQMRALRARL